MTVPCKCGFTKHRTNVTVVLTYRGTIHQKIAIHTTQERLSVLVVSPLFFWGIRRFGILGATVVLQSTSILECLFTFRFVV